jgi:hypothetical protein
MQLSGKSSINIDKLRKSRATDRGAHVVHFRIDGVGVRKLYDLLVANGYLFPVTDEYPESVPPHITGDFLRDTIDDMWETHCRQRTTNEAANKEKDPL